MVSKETIKRALERALEGFIAGAIGSLLLIMPGNFSNFKDVKAWLMVAFFAILSGGIMGLIKAFKGYAKYDKETKKKDA